MAHRPRQAVSKRHWCLYSTHHCALCPVAIGIGGTAQCRHPWGHGGGSVAKGAKGGGVEPSKGEEVCRVFGGGCRGGPGSHYNLCSNCKVLNQLQQPKSFPVQVPCCWAGNKTGSPNQMCWARPKPEQEVGIPVVPHRKQCAPQNLCHPLSQYRVPPPPATPITTGLPLDHGPMSQSPKPKTPRSTTLCASAPSAGRPVRVQHALGIRGFRCSNRLRVNPDAALIIFRLE